MAANHVLLQQISLSAPASSVTLSNIPSSGYTDLKLVVSTRDTSNGFGTGGVWDNIKIQFNSTTTNYSEKNLVNMDGSAISNAPTDGIYCWFPYAAATANTFSNIEYYIPSYTSSNYKSVSVDSAMENNGTYIAISLGAGLWSNTAAITSITLTPSLGNLAVGSSFSLYGIAAVGTTPTVVPKASGGDIVVNDGTYWIHTFYSSGVFTPQTNLSCDYLVVAGGGGTTGSRNGGGGGGGVRYGTASFSTAQTVTVGAGGAGNAATSGNNTGCKGGNSALGSINATGGGAGGGGDPTTYPALAGGSGGGGTGGWSPPDQPGASGNQGGYSPVEGYAGGAGYRDPYQTGGGGGGAGSVGGNATSTAGGSGGSGYTSSISGTSTGYAGGGGGGANASYASGGTASSGGGAGTNAASAGTSGAANTGGGGGGTGNNSGGGYANASGGSGIVIVRYLM